VAAGPQRHPDHAAPAHAEERPPWMFCMLLSAADEVGPCSYETDRARFSAGSERASTRHAGELDPLPGAPGGAGPVCGVPAQGELPLDGDVQLDLIFGAAPTRRPRWRWYRSTRSPHGRPRVRRRGDPQSGRLDSWEPARRRPAVRTAGVSGDLSLGAYRARAASFAATARASRGCGLRDFG